VFKRNGQAVATYLIKEARSLDGENEVLTFPSGFFFRMVVPLQLIELDGLVPCDTVLLIQYLDRMLWI
jgi:hypothetical protein